MHFNKIS